MSESQVDGQEDDGDLFRILVSSDIHLGYAEKDSERADDSFNSFDELLGVGVKEGVDMVLLGGDLFHDNKPSRQAEIKCIQILRDHVLGDRPVQVEYMSDPRVDFAHCKSRQVNYESHDLNISLPVFSIHGNHDDPSGLGSTSCLDLMHETGLVNYFGKVSDLKHIVVRPVLLRKAGVKVALYGLSHVKDERLHRLFRTDNVKFERPAEDPDSWFNILVLHQNRAKRGPTNYIPESFLPGFFHLVIWGHEHDCRIEPEFAESSDQDFFIVQPGSPVATSLCEGEALRKHVGILSIRADNKFKLDKYPLRTVRPLLFKTMAITDLKNLDLDEPDDKRLMEDIETKLKYEVEEMIEQASELRTGHENQRHKPLLRLRVEYTDERHTLNSARFGNMFLEEVANASEILLFKKKPAERKVKTETGVDVELAEGDAAEITMEDIIEEYFKSVKEEKHKLSVLNLKDVASAVTSFIEKDDKEALKYRVEKSVDTIFESLMRRDDGLEELDKMFVKTAGEYQEEDDAVMDIIDDDEDDTPPAPAPTRGRGRGRGSRGGSTGRGRGRGAAAAKATPVKTASSPHKRSSARTSAAAANRSSQSSTQSTLFQSFARSSAPRTSTQKRTKQMFESDSD